MFTISRSADCMGGTDTREGRRKGIRGEGKEERWRKYARHMNFKKFLTKKSLTRNHPFVAPKSSKTHPQQSENQKMCRGTPGHPPQGRGGEKEGGESE